MANKRHKNVVQMAKDLSVDQSFADDLAKRIAQRQIVKKLIALRAAKGLTQQDIADSLGCTQSRVSKLESQTDFELSLGDFQGYADALGMQVVITLMKKDASIVDMVKQHAFCIKRLTDHLAALAATDRIIAEGVSNFFGEAAFNLLRMLQDSAKKLPPREEGELPQICFETCELDDEEELRARLVHQESHENHELEHAAPS